MSIELFYLNPKVLFVPLDMQLSQSSYEQVIERSAGNKCRMKPK